LRHAASGGRALLALERCDANRRSANNLRDLELPLKTRLRRSSALFFSLLTLSSPLSGCSATSSETTPSPVFLNAKPDPQARGRMDLTKPPNIAALATGTQRPPTPEEASEELSKQGEDWLFGKGLGSTTLNVATCVIFPPYVLYLVANAGLQMAGYEPIYITDAVPEPAKKQIDAVYDGVVSVPGRIAATAAGEEFRE